MVPFVEERFPEIPKNEDVDWVNSAGAWSVSPMPAGDPRCGGRQQEHDHPETLGGAEAVTCRQMCARGLVSFGGWSYRSTLDNNYNYVISNNGHIYQLTCKIPEEKRSALKSQDM